ncbi:unnamed protein product, partial [Linum tenue]
MKRRIVLCSKRMDVLAFQYLIGCNYSLSKLNAKAERMNRKIKMIAAKKKKKIFPTTIEKGSKHVDCFSLGPPSSVCQYCAAVM